MSASAMAIRARILNRTVYATAVEVARYVENWQREKIARVRAGQYRRQQPRRKDGAR